MIRRLWLISLLAALPVVAEEPADPPPGPDGYDPTKKVTLATSDIMEVVLSHKKELGDCVVKQRNARPESSGKILMKWRVKLNGETWGVEIATPEHADTVIGQCLAGLIKEWRFPRHQQPSEPITFPFKF